jgi:alpha-mannosidase
MLVREGRMELLAGGWSSHDEACPTYEEFIANMMAGHQFILKEFGVTPRVGWQLDPFGHSSTNARLYAEMGLDALIFARLDRIEKSKRMSNKSLEYIWQPHFDLLGP